MTLALGTSAADLRVGSTSIAKMVRGSTAFWDADAADYVARVQAADGEPLELGVASAYHAFCLGCKTDGIWDALQACCIMAGARTIEGALVPLKGDAPTPYNLVSGDYSRSGTLGIKGDGATKYLNSQRSGTDDGRDDAHLAIYVSAVGSAYGAYAGNGVGNCTTLTVAARHVRNTSNSQTYTQVTSGDAVGLNGVSRFGDEQTARANGQSVAATVPSTAHPTGSLLLFRRNIGSSPQFTLGRLSFYSIGASLDLAALDARVTALMTAIGAAL